VRTLLESIDHLLAHEPVLSGRRSSDRARSHRSDELHHRRNVTVTVATRDPTAIKRDGTFAGRWISQGLPSAPYSLKDLDVNRFFVSGRLGDRQALSSATGGVASGSGARIEITRHRRPPDGPA
jgi:hypothetical protein